MSAVGTMSRQAQYQIISAIGGLREHMTPEASGDHLAFAMVNAMALSSFAEVIGLHPLLVR